MRARCNKTVSDQDWFRTKMHSDVYGCWIWIGNGAREGLAKHPGLAPALSKVTCAICATLWGRIWPALAASSVG